MDSTISIRPIKTNTESQVEIMKVVNTSRFVVPNINTVRSEYFTNAPQTDQGMNKI